MTTFRDKVIGLRNNLTTQERELAKYVNDIVHNGGVPRGKYPIKLQSKRLK